jgi:hypothetical protein
MMMFILPLSARSWLYNKVLRKCSSIVCRTGLVPDFIGTKMFIKPLFTLQYNYSIITQVESSYIITLYKKPSKDEKEKKLKY